MASPAGFEKPPQSVNVRVRYAETDKMGVVYHANYFVWFEVGRCELLRSIGSSYRDLESTGVMLPVIEAHCEYRLPARYDDELQVKTWGAQLSPARVEFRYEISRVADGTVNAVGRTVHAAVDNSGKPCRLPDHIREFFR
jgi:acyl-CoA thioester hydrolase